MDDSTRITSLHNNPPIPTESDPPYRQPGYLAATALPDGHIVAVSRCTDPRMLGVFYVSDFGSSFDRIVIPTTSLPNMIALLQDAQDRIDADARRIGELAARSVREGVTTQ